MRLAPGLVLAWLAACGPADTTTTAAQDSTGAAATTGTTAAPTTSTAATTTTTASTTTTSATATTADPATTWTTAVQGVDGVTIVSTVSGAYMTKGYQDGNSTTARFYAPTGLTFDGAGNLFITDGAAMASSGCQNPSLTYMALTARASAFAVDELKRRNL